MGVQPVGYREHEHAIHLLRCQRLRLSSRSTGWHIGELDGVDLLPRDIDGLIERSIASGSGALG